MEDKLNNVLKRLAERVEKRTELGSNKEHFLNRIDLKGFKEVQGEYREDRSLCKKTLEVKGRWRTDLQYGPQFETKLGTERAGQITIQTDDLTLFGGEGTALQQIGRASCRERVYCEV